MYTVTMMVTYFLVIDTAADKKWTSFRQVPKFMNCCNNSLFLWQIQREVHGVQTASPSIAILFNFHWKFQEEKDFAQKDPLPSS